MNTGTALGVRTHPIIEPLEARVAPATVFLSTSNANIPGDKGAFGMGAAGSVLLSAKDMLALDIGTDTARDEPRARESAAARD